MEKWKDIIPYIDDYRVAVSLDLYDYTGINFNVDVKQQKAMTKKMKIQQSLI